MKFEERLTEARFQKRYKRFFADIILPDALQGCIEVAHVANTGSLKSVLAEGAPCLVSKAKDPNRKLQYSLQALQAPSGGWVGINTSIPNAIVPEAFHAGVFPHWKNFTEIHNEVKLNKETRIDFVLTRDVMDRKKILEGKKLHFVEVKNVTLAVGDYVLGHGQVQFPDAVTERGQKHLREMMALMEQGHTAEIFFCIQREDCTTFAPADEIDPTYGKLLRQAVKLGMTVTAAIAKVTPTGVELTGKVLPVSL